MTTTNTTTRNQCAAWRIVQGAATLAAWVIGLTREVLTYRLTNDECEALGLPFDSVAPCVFVQRMEGAAWWRMDAWDDGEGCLHFRALGLWAEVHHQPRRAAQAA